jgi:hypothetical protein
LAGRYAPSSDFAWPNLTVVWFKIAFGTIAFLALEQQGEEYA